MALPSQGAYRPFGGLAPEKVRSTLTGREGKAKLESLPPGPWNVTVHARGFVTQPLRRVASGPLAVRLEKGGVDHRRRARGATASRPVPGARVVRGRRACPARRLGGRSDAQRGHDRREGPLPSRRDRPRAGRRSSRARPGFDEARSEAACVGETVELFLFPGATLAGTVRDDEGRPVKGAVVRAEGDRPWSASRPPSARMRGAGSGWRASSRASTRWSPARAGGPPGSPRSWSSPRPRPACQIVLSDGGFVTGRIVDPEGRPLAGRLRVEVVRRARGLPSSASDRWPADAKADGTFALGPLPARHAGDRRLRAAARVAEGRGDHRRRGAARGPRRRRPRDRPRDPRPGARPGGQRASPGPPCAHACSARASAAWARPRARPTAPSSSRG